MSSHVRPGSLEVRGLEKKIGGFTLSADFAIEPGERAILVGPSGSGKTSLLRLIAGLDPMDCGCVRLAGQDLSTLPPARRKIGMVFQDQALFPSMSVLENATFGLRMRGVSRSQREILGMQWLKRVGMETHSTRSIHALSGGEAQRLAWVRALIWGPELLLLDEPFSALDPALRERLTDELLVLLRDRPVPTILVSHDARDGAAFANLRLELQVSTDGARRRIVRTNQ